MNISVIGCGYVGTTTALMFCELGYQVVAVEKDSKKLAMLQQGKLPFHEPGIDSLLIKHLHRGSLVFTGDIEEGIAHSKIIYITVGTPSLPDGSSDLSFIEEVSRQIGAAQNDYKAVVIKSTVPLGTVDKVREWIGKAQKRPLPVDLVVNPEFLREGSALYDTMHPDRIVIGSDNPEAAETVKQLFHSMSCPIIVTDCNTAQLIKYTANAFLATKISFINEIGRVCDAYGANIEEVASGVGLDHRIGPHFLRAGIGWGGSCFPKDIAALINMGNNNGINLQIVQSAQQVNQDQIGYFIDRLEGELHGLNNKTVSIYGISFKPETDDIRESPSLKVIAEVQRRGGTVAAYDPMVFDKHPELKLPGVRVARNMEDAWKGSDCFFLITEWDQFSKIDWGQVMQEMRTPLVLDGRNVLDARKLRSLGFRYYGIGRKTGIIHE